MRDRIFDLSDEDIAAGGSNIPRDSIDYETSLYADGNYVNGFPEVSQDNWNGGVDFSDGATERRNRARKPHAVPAITEHSSEEAYQLVLASAGASLARDQVDARIVDEVRSGQATYGANGHIDSPADVGGYPVYHSNPAPLDSDADGMPDSFETQRGLGPNNPADRNADVDGDGYTNLEEYLNGLVAL